MAAAIDHPNVVPVHGAGEEDGQLYLVMRYVRGTDLHALIKREGPLAPERAAAIVAQVASALDAAHAAGLVHRDVKPANVLLGGSGREEHAYLSDFGLTRLLASETQLTETGQWMGTIDFSAPEQLSARPHRRARRRLLARLRAARGARRDAPVPARHAARPRCSRTCRTRSPRPSERGAPAGFDRVMARALAKEPEDRYPSAGDLGRAALRGRARRAGDRVRAQRRGRLRGARAADQRPRRAAAPRSPRRSSPTRRPRRPSPSRARRPRVTRPVAADPAAAGEAPTRHRGRRRGVVARRRARRGRRGGDRRSRSRLGDGAGAGNSTAPLSESDVRDVARGLRARPTRPRTARRSGARSPPACSACSPSGVARGRGARRQRVRAPVPLAGHARLRARGPRGARRPGRPRERRLPRRAARAGDAIEGRIVFGVVRDRGQPRIALIAVTPRGLSAQQARATTTRTVVPRRTSAARRRLLLADAQALRHERVEEAAAALALEAEAAARDRCARRRRRRRRRGPGPSPAARA